MGCCIYVPSLMHPSFFADLKHCVVKPNHLIGFSTFTAVFQLKYTLL